MAVDHGLEGSIPGRGVGSLPAVRSRRWACLCAVLWTVPVGAGATIQPAVAAASDLQAPELTVSWKAFVAQDGGSFRLYDLTGDRPTLVGERPATTGAKRYSLRLPARSLQQHLELRYVHPGGGEQVLEATIVRHATSRGEATTPQRSQDFWIRLCGEREPWARVAGAWLAPAGRPADGRPAPETPPPIAWSDYLDPDSLPHERPGTIHRRHDTRTP